MQNTPITLTVIGEGKRLDALPSTFPKTFMHFENQVYRFARHFSDYSGGFWEFYRASNGAFLMAPEGEFHAQNTHNGADVQLNGKAFGLCICLMVMSDLSELDDPYADQYFLLRDVLFDCPDFDSEREKILKFIN